MTRNPTPIGAAALVASAAVLWIANRSRCEEVPAVDLPVIGGGLNGGGIGGGGFGGGGIGGGGLAGGVGGGGLGGGGFGGGGLGGGIGGGGIGRGGFTYFGQGTLDGVRDDAERSLKAYLDFISGVATLSDRQRAKLELAGQGDINLFLDEFEAMSTTATSGSLLSKDWRRIDRDFQTLARRYRAGLHRPGSLFRKTLHSALSAEQLTVLDDAERDRYRKQVQSALLVIAPRLTEQRSKAIVETVVESTEPFPYCADGHVMQEMATAYVLQQMAQIEDVLKPLVPEHQWRELQPYLDIGRRRRF